MLKNSLPEKMHLYFQWIRGKTNLELKYLDESYQCNSENHAGVDPAWKAIKNATNRMNNFPEWKYYQPTHCYNVCKFASCIV